MTENLLRCVCGSLYSEGSTCPNCLGLLTHQRLKALLREAFTAGREFIYIVTSPDGCDIAWDKDFDQWYEERYKTQREEKSLPTP